MDYTISMADGGIYFLEIGGEYHILSSVDEAMAIASGWDEVMNENYINDWDENPTEVI